MKLVIPASEAYREGRNWKIPVDLLKATVENKAIKEAQERRRLHEKVQSSGL